MSKLISFLRPVDELIANKLFALLPGIEQVSMIQLVWNTQKAVSSVQMKMISSNIQSSVISAEEVEYYMKKAFNFQNIHWISRQSSDFSSYINNSQVNIFSETENTILLIKIKKEKNGILWALQFRKDKTTFGLSKSDQTLDTTTKSMIGNLILNFIQSEYRQIEEDRQIYSQVIQPASNLHEQLKLMEVEQHAERENMENLLVNYFNQLIINLSHMHQKHFSFTAGALKKLLHYKGEINDYEKIIEQAAVIAQNYQYKHDEIEIEEFYINLPEKQVNTHKIQGEGEESQIIDYKYQRAYNLLNRLEDSADLVLENNLPLTSANVGKYFDPPITAPAISDALKKHQRKVLYLLDQFPHKWNLIRTEFKPLQNVINRIYMHSA